MIDPFKYEIELRGNKNSGRRRNSILPYLYPHQYGQELYPENDFEAIINAYKSWIYVAASKNASSVANVPLRLYVAKNKKARLKGYPTRSVEMNVEKEIREDPFLQNISAVRKAVEFEEILDHPYLDLMRNVNGFMGAYDLKEMTQLYQELTGNAYWYIVEDKLGVPREIWVIPPQNCKIIPHPQKFISGYKYTRGYENIDLNEKSVIHFKTPNPKSVYYGYPPFMAVSEEYGLTRSINEYETAIFKNGGHLSGVFETEQELGDHEFERLKQEIKDTFTGARNAGKMPLLDHGLKYKPLGTSPKEMSYLGGREVVKEAILNAYGLALGLFSTAANRSNVDGAIYQYMKFTVAPKLARTQEKINEKLIGRYDDRLFLKFDNCVPEDRQFNLDQRIKHVQTSITSVDEERIGLGKKPLGGVFREPFIPVNYTSEEGLLASIANGTGEGNIIDDEEKMKDLIERNK